MFDVYNNRVRHVKYAMIKQFFGFFVVHLIFNRRYRNNGKLKIQVVRQIYQK